MADQAGSGIDGMLLVDKPQGWTSHDVVARARRLLGTRKVGHAGTLDPMATGLLVLAAGRATRLLTYVTGHDKHYQATIRLGVSTVTDDAEGDVVSTADASGVGNSDIAAAVDALTGHIMQSPSAVSAIKVDGKRSYARVRAGEDVALPPRPVTVTTFRVDQVRREGTHLDLDVAVDVSSGTYVRALARDLGAALGVGGHLTALRRTRVGALDVNDAVTLEELAARVEAGAVVDLVPLDAAAAAILPALPVTPAQAGTLGFGKVLPGVGDALGAPRTRDDHTADAVALDPTGAAIAVVRRSGNDVRPVIVFRPAAAPHRGHEA